MPVDYNSIEVKEQKIEKDTVEESKPKVQTVVSKKPKKHKKNLMERLVVGVLGPDGLPSITSYINHEIIVPAVKNIIVDGITSGINMMMFGAEQRRNGQGGVPPHNYGGPSQNHWSSPPRTNYSQNYRPGGTPPQNATTYATRPAVAPARSANQVEDYIINDRHEAIGVLDALVEQINTYGNATVADYYDMIGVESRYTDNTYGWTVNDVQYMKIVPARGGYSVYLPQVSVV